MAMRPTTAGIKNDQTKVDLSLLSAIWVMGVGRVLTFGKRKYAAHNWRQGLAMSRLLASCLRHVFAFLSGEDRDFDPNCEGCKSGDCLDHSGENHLDCASCCLMFARELFQTRPDLDDRYKAPVPAAPRETEVVVSQRQIVEQIADDMMEQQEALFAALAKGGMPIETSPDLTDFEGYGV